MDDRDILELYNARNESAIDRTAEKYGSYCRAVAFHILQNDEDAEECVNDTWWRAWNVIPPQNPPCLRLFLGKITRNLSLDVFKRHHREKRGGGSLPLVLEELKECLPAQNTTEEQVDETLLTELIDRFMSTLSERDRWIFLRRYWNTDSVQEIADALAMDANTVKVMLYRTRKKLRCALEKEGFLSEIGGSV